METPEKQHNPSPCNKSKHKSEANQLQAPAVTAALREYIWKIIFFLIFDIGARLSDNRHKMAESISEAYTQNGVS